MRTFMIAPAIALILAAGAVFAQAADDGYPLKRMRLVRDDSHFPEPYYLTNRVVLKNVALAPAGSGVQLSGELLTDFEADRVPADAKGISRGQQKVRVELELVQFHTNLQRENGRVLEPNVRETMAAARGPQVQAHETMVEGSLGGFGHGRFLMPALDKPLAPGVYALIARVTFKAQRPEVQRAIKWCSDWYGAVVAGTDEAGTPFFRPVMGDETEHEKYYDEVMNNPGMSESICLLYVGQTLKDGAANLTASGNKGANYVLLTPQYQVAAEIRKYELEIINAPVIEADLIAKLKDLDQPKGWGNQKWADHLARKKEEYKADTALTIKTNTANIRKRGGGADKIEIELIRTTAASCSAVLDQIANFEDSLCHRYWVLEGWLRFGGYNAVSTAGGNASDACANNDLRGRKEARLAQLAALREDGAEKAFWEKHQQDTRFIPLERRALYFDWLKLSIWKDQWDADKFCRKEDNKVVLDTDKWREFRVALIEKLRAGTDKIFAEVTTTDRYANQVWPNALADAHAARDAVCTLAYAYEYHIRTQHLKHPGEQVVKAWKDEAAQLPAMGLDKYLLKAQGTPATVYATYDAALKQIARTTNREQLKYWYAKAIEAGAKTLPGEE
ncbi:MAG: hypothetical protein IPK87_06745 [Planctomycetes bacterium]|nr:hypothetical protein [Planctomycetota bacterium]